MKPRILIVADTYGKPAYAPRLRYFCDYLTRQGYAIAVYTEQFHPLDFPHTYPIYEKPISYHNLWQWAIQSAWSLLTDWRNRQFSKWLDRQTAGQTFDLVFCTTFSTFPLRAAADIARRRKLPLVVDIRDLEEQVPGAQYQAHRQWWVRPFRNWYSRANIRRRNRVLPFADCITTISPWHVDFIRRFNPNVHLIYNGYDPAQFYPENVPTDQFLISYIGKIYEFQDITPLERAVEELHIPDIRLNYHTPTYRTIPIHAVGDELRRSSIAVVLTSTDTHGMMTTKFYEALGCEKPILCIPSDNGLLAKTMQETNAGLATSDIESIKSFILEKYREWQTHGYTRQPVRHTAPFSREYQSHQLEKLLLALYHPEK